MGGSVTRPAKVAPAEQPVVLIPLYIYPLEGAWEPLFTVARAFPDVLFVTVVNPCNGPGPDALPDASYVAVLNTLNAIPNIRPVGYVHCTYGKRPIADVLHDVDVYRGWNDTFRLEGIFVDETPSDRGTVGYLDAISDHTKSTWQTCLGRQAFVIYNPGVVVDRAFFRKSDWVVVFEQSEHHWKTRDIQASLNSLPPELRHKAVAMVHSLSGDLDEAASLCRFIRLLGFGGIHLTEQLGGGYTEWPVMWATQAEGLRGCVAK